tara:strand:+ start:1012 stop:1272 length:261 start_codon:yes stop_codon:yes gene_type:complete
MTEKKFGVRDLEIIDPTGTPTIESSGDLIVNAGGAIERLRVTSSGIDVTGSVVSDAGTLGSNGNGSRTVSTSDPSGGSDGDVWYKV